MTKTPPPNDEFDLPEARSNRPVRLSHRIEYAAARAILGLSSLLGLDRASALYGSALGAIGPRLRSISRRGEDNLRLIYPDWDDQKIRSVIKEVWTNLGRVGAEYPHLEKISTRGDAPRITVSGVEDMMAAYERAGRAVFVTGHFANWEVAGITAHELGLPFGVVYRALNNPLLDAWIIRKRGAVMTRRQIPKGAAGARAMIDLLKDGASIAFLADQKLNTGGIRVPFMGYEAMTAPAAARIAVRFSLPVIPITVARADGARFHVTVRPPIDFAPQGDLAADVERLTILINKALERDVRARPGDWLWLHRRWGENPQPVSRHSPS